MTEIPDNFSLPNEAFERQRALLSARVAHRGRRASSRGRRPLAAALALAVLLGVLLVTPAFGLGGRLLDAINGKPAPTEVKAFFASNDQGRARLFAEADRAGAVLHDRFSPVLADETRGVFAIQTSDGPIFLWAAPTEDGRECWLLQTTTTTAGGSTSCDEKDSAQAMQPEIFWTEDRPNIRIVHARILDESIARITVEVEGGPEVSLPAVDGHGLGTVAKDARIIALVGRDADGTEVARFPVR